MNVDINTATCLTLNDHVLVVFMPIYDVGTANIIDICIATTLISIEN